MNYKNANLLQTYLLMVRPNVTWTSAIRVLLTHLNTGERTKQITGGQDITNSTSNRTH